jgi:ABC-type nitrate/sulfonate/bicarbonate transport system permease component
VSRTPGQADAVSSAGAPVVLGTGPAAGRVRGIRSGPVVGWIGLILAILLIWYLVVQIGSVPPIIAPSPVLVIQDLWVSRSDYLVALAQTTTTAYLGLLLGTVAGGSLAVASWWSSGLNGGLRPIVYFMQAIPMTAMIPVVSGVVGYGYAAVITLTTMSAMFPTFIIFGTALSRSTDGAADVMSALGASRAQYLTKVALPAALPSLFNAMQLGATLSVLGSFATEYLQGGWGLGGLFAVTRRIFENPATPWGIALLTTLLSSLSYGLFHWIARAVQKRLT